jgi:phage recombination protein Bet
MSDALAKSNVTHLAPISEWTPEQKALIKRTVAKDCSDDELAMFLHVAAKSGLDPLLKQIHCLKVGGRLAFIADINGLQARAARQPDYEGIDHAVVFEKDEFLVDQKTGEILKHVSNPFTGGKPVGAWAVVHRKGMRPFRSMVKFSEYSSGNNPLWASKPGVMIDKVAKSTAYRLAYPEEFGQLYERAEFDRATTDDAEPRPTAKDAAKAKASAVVVDAKPVQVRHDEPAPKPLPALTNGDPDAFEKLAILIGEADAASFGDVLERVKDDVGKGRVTTVDAGALRVIAAKRQAELGWKPKKPAIVDVPEGMSEDEAKALMASEPGSEG